VPRRSEAKFLVLWVQQSTSTYNRKMCPTVLFLLLRSVIFLSLVCSERQQQEPVGHWLLCYLSTPEAMSSSMLPGV